MAFIHIKNPFISLFFYNKAVSCPCPFTDSKIIILVLQFLYLGQETLVSITKPVSFKLHPIHTVCPVFKTTKWRTQHIYPESCPCEHAKSFWLCPTLCDAMGPPASSVHGILQARILDWVAISYSRIMPSSTVFTLQLQSPQYQKSLPLGIERKAENGLEYPTFQDWEGTSGSLF